MQPDKQQQLMQLMSEYRAEEARESWLNRETRRNLNNIALFEAMIRLAYPDTIAVIAGHHIMVTREGQPHPMEIASADTLIFDPDIAKACWGADWMNALAVLAATPVDCRDDCARAMLNHRHGTKL
jgi:hypothetical protein